MILDNMIERRVAGKAFRICVLAGIVFGGVGVRAQDADPFTSPVAATDNVQLWRNCIKNDGMNITAGGRVGASGPNSKAGSHLTMAAGEGRVFVKGLSGKLRAFDAATGAPQWATQVGGAAKGDADTDAVVIGGGVVATGAGKDLVGLDAATGKVLWTVPGCGRPHASAIRWVADGVVRFLTPTGACIDPATGKVLWRAPGVDGVIACDAGHLVAIAKGGAPGAPLLQCFSINPAGAKPAWAVTARQNESNRDVTPTIHRGYVYARIGAPVSGGARDLYQSVCVDLASGEVKASEPGSRSFSSLVSGDGLVFNCGAANIRLHAADPQHFAGKGGKPVADAGGFESALRGAPETTAVFLDGRLFSRTFDGIVCYDLRGTAANRERTSP